MADSLDNVRCAYCDRLVESDITTVDGRLVQYVRACKPCVRETMDLAVRHALRNHKRIDRRRGHIHEQALGMLPAIDEGAQLSKRSRPISHGHATRVCPDCGKRTRRMKGQKRIARCEPCFREHVRTYQKGYARMIYFRDRHGVKANVTMCPDCNAKRPRQQPHGRYISRCKDCKREAGNRHSRERRVA